MRKTLISFRCFASRFKLIAALIALFCSGALFTVGACAWHYGRVIEQVNAAHERQIVSLRDDLDGERVINRQILFDLTTQVKLAVRLLEQAAKTARIAAGKAQDAAKTADSAAAQANTAARNAAKANIRITEVPPEPEPARRIEP